MRLQAKTALITGAARGIGLAIARAFAREGANVVIADINGDAAATAVEELLGCGSGALGVQMDVSQPNAIRQALDLLLQKFGRLDVLVNNAGVGGNTPFLDMPFDEWEETLRINLTGAFLVAQSSAREMAKSGGGSIINITSTSGQRGGDGRAAYGASKAALAQLTEVMAVELAPLGIRVNNIAPGPVETEMARSAHD